MELVKYDAACRALAEARVAGFSHLRQERTVRSRIHRRIS